MKKITLFFAGAALLLLVSCGAKDELAFNNKLVNLQKGLLEEVNKMKNDTTGGPVETLKKMQGSIKAKITELSAVKAPSDGDAFKSAMMDDFEAVNSSYDVLIKIANPDISEADKTELTNEITTWQSKIEVLDEKVITEQKKFASAHNIKLQ